MIYLSGKIKIIADPVVALLALVLTSPVFLVLAILIKFDSKGPVFFIQERLGKGGKPFRFIKFRTMVQDAEKIGLGKSASENDPRITKIGKFLREWTIDEMPQFINILRGEMSFVGPRPWIAYTGHDEEMKKLWRKRISVKPGLISLVDMRGRNLLPWAKRLEYDSWYIDNCSLWLDLKILFFGFFAVLSRHGVYGENGINPHM